MSSIVSLREGCNVGEYKIIEECIPVIYKNGINIDKTGELCPLFETCLYEANHHYERHQEMRTVDQLSWTQV